MKTLINNYLHTLYPFKLQEDEYICLFITKGTYKQNLFFKDFESVEQAINQYKHTHDVYICLSTTKGNEKRIASKMNRRSCVVFDFDFKDHGNNQDINDYIYKKFKATFKTLYSPYVVASGNGVHIYCFIEPTTNTKQLAELNKEMASVVGADVKACLQTQVIRVPSTYNHKHGTPKRVAVYFDKTNEDNFKRYKIDTLKAILSKAAKQEQAEEVRYKTVELPKFKNMKPCVKAWLNNGVGKGYRNLALGRIIYEFKRLGHQKEDVRNTILTWNSEKCNPSKAEREVLQDFENYWNNDYKLGGCTSPNPIEQGMIEEVCNRFECEYVQVQAADKSELDLRKVSMNNKWLRSELIRNMDTKCYLIIGALMFAQEHKMNHKELESFLKPVRKTDKAVIGGKKLYKLVDELEKHGIIEIIRPKNPTLSSSYKLKNVDKTYGTGYTEFVFGAIRDTINKNITPSDLKVYLAIAKLKTNGEVSTVERISEITGILTSNIRKSIGTLQRAKLIDIVVARNEKNVEYNKIYLVA